MENAEIGRVKDVLKTYPKGITIAELAKQLSLNRISTSKYLNMLLASGQAEMRIFGPSKVFYPSQRIPLSTILNFSTSHLLVMDDNLTIIDANDALLRFFALEKKDLVGQRVDFSLLAVYFDPTLVVQLKKSLESQESTLETRVTMQGKEYILEIKCIPTVFESGDHGVSLIADDITELTQYRLHLEQLVDERAKELQKTNDNLKREINNHKKARSELKISEIKYRELVESANSIILKTDTEGKVVFFNEFAQQFFGYTESEILGKSIYDAILPETDSSGKNIREIRQQLRTNPDTYGIYEGENIKRNGERIWISWTHKFIRNTQGVVTGILSIGNDITERKRAEEALKVSEERFRLAMDASSDGIWDWDITTDNGYFSPAYCRMLGYEPGEFPQTGQTWVTLIHPDDKEHALSINQDCIENRCQSFEVEFRLKAKDGSWKWIMGRGKAVSRNAEGRALRIIGTHVDITERKRAEEALKGSEERFRLAMEASSDGIWEGDFTTGTGYLSPNYYRMLGYEPGEFPPIYQEWVALIHPDDKEHALSINQGCIENRCQSFEVEFRLKAKDGSWRWVLSRARAVSRDAEGRALRIIGTHIDITERKRVEEALRISEERFRLAMEASSDGICDWDITSGKGKFNISFYRMLGYEPDEFPPTSQMCSYLIHPDDRERILVLEQDCIENRSQSFETEYRIKAKDGSWRWMLARGKAVSRDKAGYALRIIGALTDITERKRVEDALKISEERFRRIFDDSPLGMTVINPNYRFILVNRRICDMLGYTEEELLEKSVDDVTHPDDIYATFENLRNFSTGNISRAYHEKRYLKKDGSAIWVAVTVTSLRDRENRVTSTISIIEDITKRKRDESRLIESEAMLREVLNNANDAVFLHEVTPEGPGRYLLVNDQATRWLGYTKEEFMEMSPRDIVPKNIFDKIQPHNSKMLLDDKPITFESVHKRKDGSTYPVEVSAHKFRFNEKDVVLSTARDITDRKQTENAIRENHVRLKEAMDLAHLANWELDHKTGMYTFDDRFYALYGTTAEREGGYRMPADVYFREFVHPDDRGRINEELERCREISDPDYISQQEHRIIRRDGGIRYIIVRAERTTDNDGHIVKIQGVNQDITERKIAEEKLRRSEQKLSAIVDFLPYATFVVDTSGTIIAWNRAMEKLTGRKGEDIIGRGNFEHGFVLYGKRAPTLIDFVVYPDMEIPEKYHIVKLEKNKLVARTYSTHIRSDGLTLLGFAVPLYDSNGNLVGAIESMRDVTTIEMPGNVPTTYTS